METEKTTTSLRTIEPVQIPQTITEWQDAIHKWAAEKGWTTLDRTFGDVCALFHTEISEAYEEWRAGHRINEVYYNDDNPKPEGIGIELADLVIRVLQFAGDMGLDMQALIEQKMAYNKTRPYRHGGKKS